MRRATAALALAALAALAASCARTGPPGGGPEDTTPPEVVSTHPEEGATGVARDTVVRIAFSEEMRRVSVERALSVAPDTVSMTLSWEGRALLARPRRALPDSTTLVLTLGESAQDYHGVPLGAPFVLAFSTGPSVDTGVISGTVTSLGEPVAGAVVWACRRPPGTGPAGLLEPCRYSAVTAEDGAFRIERVAASDRPYTLVAFVDGNGDGGYSVREERGVIADAAALIVEPGATALGIHIELAGVFDENTPAIMKDGSPPAAEEE